RGGVWPAFRAPALGGRLCRRNRILGEVWGGAAAAPPDDLAARQPRGRGVARREDDANPLLDREPRGDHVVLGNDDDVTEVEVIRRDEDRHHVALAVGRLEQELARDEAERVLA